MPASLGETTPPGVTWELTLQPVERTVCLRCRIANPRLGLRPRLLPLAVDGISRPDHELEMAGDDARGYAVHLDGVCVARPADRVALVGDILARLLPLVHAPRRTALLLHAAALVVDGVTVLLSAPSGGGKTTLALGLVRGGATLLGDDTAGVLADGFAIAGFPAALRVRDSGWPVVAPLLDATAVAAVHEGPGRRHLPPRTLGSVAPLGPPAAAVIILDRRPGRGPTVADMPPLEGLDHLICGGATLTGAVGEEEAAALVTRWGNGLRFFRLGYGTLAEGMEGVHAVRARVP
ncbi:hypothetical protein [Azospirillum halopraeferens]|uniref:hypothetical protein n=1 Tax=Azospirillum halopraeferens TaxID=34010 RepID=UPI00040A6402|nr:hypothetical protein [Azospirillum halopraeferens]